ncbi:MAG: DUF6786 family protein [Cyclobacteriaceae bacterium]
MMKTTSTILLTVAIVSFTACNQERKQNNDQQLLDPNLTVPLGFTTFQDDLDFLKEHIEVLVLEEAAGKGKIAVSPRLQGRVMTSTSDGSSGRSYGWINRKLFTSGDTLEHINAFGGEERFWLGPEGGQFSIFFKKDDPFDLEHWQTPALIDLEPFNLQIHDSEKAVFTKSAELTNYSGFTFRFDIERIIEILQEEEILQILGLPDTLAVNTVGYQSTNSLTNRGKEPWQKETGLLSIWLLGMFNPSHETTIVIPYVVGDSTELGAIVNDAYFGKVPGERLKIGEGAIYFSGDGQFRSKIGLLPSRAKNVMGSYNADNQTLTIVKYNKPEGVNDYVNSTWEIQDAPYRGDVVNSYNDGPPEPGVEPLGPFYELESSSPALSLEVGASGTHIQQTFHFEGDREELNIIAEKVLGVSISKIEEAF